MSVKLSVVIPVYNTALTLDRCVASVVSQDVDDMEIILVDDGSPDNSPAMCDEWSKRDERVIVIHKTNGGLSDARNAGIDMATGRYITFIDSDDYISDDTYSTLLNEISTECDILEYPIFQFYGSPREHLLSFKHHEYYNDYDYWIGNMAYSHCYVCNKIFKRDLFDEIRFPKGFVFEDTIIMPQLIEKAKRIDTTNHGMYYYCWNNNGITATADGLKLKMLLDTNVKNKWILKDDKYYMYMLNIQMDVYQFTGGNIVLPTKRIRNLGLLDNKKKIKAIMLNILGLKTLCKINKSLHRIIKHH